MNRDRLVQGLAKAYGYFKGIGDSRNTGRISSLAEKLHKMEFGIAFAGHFSAGKSRMINELLEENILPSSPIPTSANLVRVSKGDDFAKVIFREGTPRKYLAPYDYDVVRGFARDGDQVSEIELCRSDIDLPEGVVIMDTPGIDSADDAHRLATEDALHLADVIFYCMDYNHVQAELNLSFTRELTEAGKDVYLVVNQIDKHRTQELSFENFKKTAEQAFSSWGVKPRGFFYTSLKDKTHEHNQLEELKSLIYGLMKHHKEGLEDKIYTSLKKILDEHLTSKEAEINESTASACQVLKELDPERETQLRDDYRRLSEELKSIEADWEQDYRSGVQRILDNAYLMPTSTRDLARDYLIACQPDFKVGLFGRGKKTMAELERRREAFFSDASEKAKTQIEWHLKTYLTDFVHRMSVSEPKVIGRIQSIEIRPSEELLTEAMRSGAKLTQDGSYVMNYTQNFAEGIKQVAREAAGDVKKDFSEALAIHRENRRADIKLKLAEMEEYAAAWGAIDEAVARLELCREEIEQLLQADSNSHYTLEELLPKKTDCEVVTSGDGLIAREAVSKDGVAGAESNKEITAETEMPLLDTVPNNEESSKVKINKAVEKLNTVAKGLGVIPSLKHMAKELGDRAKRLENKGFLVTLFGAFSAGKSSFANAILGEELLPVSPNPTTAAINMIMPVDSKHHHGFVEIKLKSKEMLLADLNRAFGVFGVSADSLAEAREKAAELLSKDSYTQQQEKSFLRAFYKGVDGLEEKLGQEFDSDLQGFREFAAQEDKSCFVDWIKVYYSCPFTDQGITLVDTPGADSINARHTNMSFQFIRQSDVILYVNYYNHAFSKADREFVIQLGRVKDVFQMDKMFFIVNAIDLAENEEEVQHVKDYIRSQLRGYGVKNPQLFALSSRELLKNRISGQGEKTDFENRFYGFVNSELTDIALSEAYKELDRAREALEGLVRLSSSSQEEKRQRKQQLEGYKARFDELMESINYEKQLHLLVQECSELIYYVKQRVFLRYHDFYRESFNSATLISGGNSKKQLKEAMGQLLDSIGFDLAQELRATVLRLDSFAVRLASGLQDDLYEDIRNISSELLIGRKEVHAETRLDFTEAFKDADYSAFSKPLALYKNPKDFFEGGTTKVVQEQLELILSDMADRYLSSQQSRIQSEILDGLTMLLDQVKKHIAESMAHRLDGYFIALTDEMSSDELQRVYNGLFK